MTIELECGSCGRRLQANAGDGVVECPHCRTALRVPGQASSASQPPEDGATRPFVAESVTDVENESLSQFAFLDDPRLQPAAVPDSKVFPGFPIGEDDSLADVFPSRKHGLHAGLDFAIAPPAAGISDKSTPRSETGTQTSPAPLKPGNSTTAVSKATATLAVSDEKDPAESEAVPSPGVPRLLFVMLAGYASAVTIALIWLWLTRGRVHPLESLPDLEPKSTSYIVPEDSQLPQGHTLQLGETRRYGNLEVTPLRVTRGPAKLVLVSEGNQEDATGGDSQIPVLKLWLRLRNVSNGQTFRPFGRELLRLPHNSRSDRFNTFVCKAGDQNQSGHRVLVYRLDQERRDLALGGQDADRELAPKETYETYIATTDRGIDELQGDLVWRVHFRKGLNAKSQRGVTTLIDVAFHSDKIQDEARRMDDGAE